MSASLKLLGASLKVKFSYELLSLSLLRSSPTLRSSDLLTRSIATLSLPPTPVLPTASCQAVPTVTVPVPSEASVAEVQAAVRSGLRAPLAKETRARARPAENENCGSLKLLGAPREGEES